MGKYFVVLNDNKLLKYVEKYIVGFIFIKYWGTNMLSWGTNMLSKIILKSPQILGEIHSRIE